jgi:hypothetical protein
LKELFISLSTPVNRSQGNKTFNCGVNFLQASIK